MMNSLFMDFETEKYKYIQKNVVSTKLLSPQGITMKSVAYDASIYQNKNGVCLAMDHFVKCGRKENGSYKCREEDFSEIKGGKSLDFLEERVPRNEYHR